MRVLLVVFIIAFCHLNGMAQTDALSTTEQEILMSVDSPPIYPGGEREMMKFLATNIKYPKEAKKAGITGTVLAQFIINKDGRVTDINILRGIGAGCDVETKRVISEMPLWNPAQMKGKPVNFQLVLPVKFSL